MYYRRSLIALALLLISISLFASPDLTDEVKSFLVEQPVSEYKSGKIHLNEAIPYDILEDSTISRADKIEMLKGFTKASQQEAMSVLRKLESTGDAKDIRQLWIVNVISFTGNKRVFEKLASTSLDCIIDIDEAQPALLDDFDSEDFTFDYDSLTWGLRHCDVADVWHRFGLIGNGVNLAIFDTGVQPTHPDHLGELFVNEGEIPNNGIDDDDNGYVDDYHGYNFVESEGDEIPWDDRGHGTHVGGTMSSNGGYGYQTGMAPGAKLLVCKTINSTGNGELADSWAAVGYTLEMGVKVANLSIGWLDLDNIDRATWRESIINARMLGLLLVVSAGNEGGSTSSCENLRTPGDVPEALTIGGTNLVDSRDSYTSAGPVGWGDVSPWYDYPCLPGCFKPDLMAPGTRITAPSLFAGYMRKTGTSMATPHVAGACALLLQADSTLTPDGLIRALTETAIDGGEVGRDNLYGYGRMDIQAAIEYVLDDIGYIKIFTEPYAEVFIEPGRIYQKANESGTVVLGSTNESVRNITIKMNGFIDFNSIITFTHDTTDVLGLLTARAEVPQAIFVHDFSNDEMIDSVMVVNQYGDTAFTSGDGICYLNGFADDSISLDVVKPGYITRNLILPGYAARNRHIFIHKAEDFEDDDHGFEGTGDWEFGIPDFELGPDARSGEKLFATVLDMKYNNMTNSMLKSPVYFLSEENPTMYFHHWLNSEATDWGIWDGGNVKISTDGGESFEIIFPEESYDGHVDDYNEAMPWEPAYAGTLLHMWWDQEEYDLSEYSGDSVIIGFHFTADDNSRYPGWYIDDFAIVPSDSRPPVIDDVLAIFMDDALNFGIKTYGVNCDIELSSVFLHYSIDYAPFDSTLCFLEAGTDSFYGSLDSFPVIFDIEYYFTSRDECGRQSRFPEDSNLTGSFGVDSFPPEIEILNFRDKTISRYDYMIKAQIVDSLSGVDESSIRLEYSISGSTDTLSIEFSERYCNTFVFYIPDTLTNGDYIDFRIHASDIAVIPNRCYSDEYTIDILDIAHFDFATLPIFSIAPDTIWSWNIDDGYWQAGNGDNISPGLAELILPDLALFGLENAYMTFDIISDLPAESGILLQRGSGLLEPISGYTTFIPGLSGLGLGGVISSWRTYTIILDEFVDDRGHIQVKFYSDGVPGFFAIDNLVFYAFEERIEDLPLQNYQSASIQAYPNPSKGCFEIRGSGLTGFSIYDIKGEIVKQLHNTTHKLEWHVTGYIDSGLYIIVGHCQDGSAVSSKLLILK